MTFFLAELPFVMHIIMTHSVVWYYFILLARFAKLQFDWTCKGYLNVTPHRITLYLYSQHIRKGEENKRSYFNKIGNIHLSDKESDLKPIDIEYFSIAIF